MDPRWFDLAMRLGPWVVQATLVGLTAWIVARVGIRWTPRARHAALVVGLVAFAVPPFLRLPYLPSAGAAVGALAEATRGGGAWVVPGSWLAAAVAVWAFGALAVLAALVAQIGAVRRLRREAWPVQDAVACRQRTEVAGRLGLARAPDLLASCRVRAPMLTGWGKPAILVPPHLASRTGERAFSLILAHELAHLKQHDLVVNAAVAVLCAVWWPHPLIWALSAASRRVREEIADDTAIEAIEAIGGRPGDYARALLSAASARPTGALGWAAAGAWGSGARTLKRRLTRALDPTTRRSRRLATWQTVAVGFACGVALNGPAVELVRRGAGDTTAAFVHLSGHRAHHAHHHGGAHGP